MVIPIMTGGHPQDQPPVVRVRVFVDGRVQGVGFRMSAAQEAARLGLAGWVRNLPDGRVEAVYQGTRDAVEQMLAWTRRGPLGARVDEMTIHDEEPERERGFSVR
jgi:acylphosphatase